MFISVTLTVDSTLAELVAAHSSAAHVLHRHRLDFCCHGARTLKTACALTHRNADAILAEVKARAIFAMSSESSLGDLAVGEQVDWTTRSQAQLVHYIVGRFHEPLREELPRLNALVRKVARVHGDKDARLKRLASFFDGLSHMLVEQLDEEERVLFPWILQTDGVVDAAAVDSVQHEHRAVADALDEIHALTDGYVPPPVACASWRALLHGFDNFERELMKHIHVENNVLFPRITGAAREAPRPTHHVVEDRAFSA